MPKINGNEIRPGNVLEHNGGLWAAVKVDHVKPGKGGAFAQVELKNLRNGTKLNERFRSADKVERVANMSRLLGLGLSLSTPTVWGRAEFAVENARLLMRRQDVPQLMGHAERNVANLNELINHIDELYLADLSESNNRLSFYLSMLLAGLSLSVIVFTVISFWADSNQLAPGSVPEASRALVPQLVSLGNILSLALSAIAIAIIIFGIGSFTRNMLRARGRRQLYGPTRAGSGRSR